MVTTYRNRCRFMPERGTHILRPRVSNLTGKQVTKNRSDRTSETARWAHTGS